MAKVAAPLAIGCSDATGEGKIILMRYAQGSESTEQREKGFTDTIKKYPKITYLSDNQYAGATSDSSPSKEATFIGSHPIRSTK